MYGIHKKKARYQTGQSFIQITLGTTPVTGNPPITTTLMRPVTGDPDPTPMRRKGPVTAYSYIGAAAGFPFFIDPHMPGAGSHRPGNGVPNGMYRDIDLSRSLIGQRTCRDHYHYQKCQFYNFTFHMLVFKFIDWKVSNTKS
jgi:hypothetical protein